MFQLIKNARVFAPAALGNCDILTAYGYIVAVGPGLEAPTGIDTGIVDLGGRILLPGLIDGHAHIGGGGGESGYSSRVPPLAVSRFTRAGVTSVVGVLGTDDCTRHTRELVAQTLALREEGISAWCHTGGYHVPVITVTGSVRDDIVFIDPIIGVGELALSDHRSSQPTLDELLRIASEAHVAGLLSGKAGIVHLHLGDGERGLRAVREALDRCELPARVFNPTHVNRRRQLFEEALDLAARGCFVDVTAFPIEDGDDAWSAADAVRRFIDSGAPVGRITVSSDGGGCLPEFDDEGRMLRMDIGEPAMLAETLAELMASGLSPEIAVAPFTSNAAQLLRLPKKGVIRVGAHADLVALDDEYRINDVMARGRWHLRNGALERHGRFEGAV
ncbi:MAG: beta-aspartyl-peptidase [Gammaproteobacteria bacterium]